MMSRATSRCVKSAVGQIQARSASSNAANSATPRHLLSISQLSPAEFSKLVLNASAYKQATKAAFAAGPGQVPQTLDGKLKGRTVAMMFSKRSTRTRVSTEAAVALMGGHAMFLGKDDIQLGVSAGSYAIIFLPKRDITHLRHPTGQRVPLRHFRGHLLHDLLHGSPRRSSLGRGQPGQGLVGARHQRPVR